LRLVGAGGAGVLAYWLVVTGKLTLDVGIGRRTRPLGPLRMEVAARPETLFDVIAGPYLERTPKALSSEIEVLERGADIVVAAHHTPVAGGLVATTVESVGFDRPRTVTFRLLRGPVPYVHETFSLGAGADGSTRLEYTGELGTDLWAPGAWWGKLVARTWVETVAASLERIRTEAERKAAHRGR
jgi:hypothetical protein